MRRISVNLDVDDDVYEVLESRARHKRRTIEREANYILMRAATGQSVEPVAGVEPIDSISFLRRRFAAAEWDPALLDRSGEAGPRSA